MMSFPAVRDSEKKFTRLVSLYRTTLLNLAAKEIILEKISVLPNIKFEHIKRKDNLFADKLSRAILYKETNLMNFFSESPMAGKDIIPTHPPVKQRWYEQCLQEQTQSTLRPREHTQLRRIQFGKEV